MSQRAAFCVYSGKGVSNLRSFLTLLFNQITREMNSTDGTEYDDDSAEKSQEDIPDADMETGDDDDEPPRTFVPPTTMTVYQGQSLNDPVNPHPFTVQSDPLGLQYAIPPAVVPDGLMEVPSAVNLNGSHIGTSRPGILPAIPRRTRGFGQQVVVETSASPPSDAASNRSAQSSNGGFFRTYQEVAPTSRSNGALTPDLNFAEIGHGRGSAHIAPVGSGVFAQPCFRQAVESLPYFDPVVGSSSQVIIPVMSSPGYEPDTRDEPVYDPTTPIASQSNSTQFSQWPYVQHEPPSPSPSPNSADVHDSVPTALERPSTEGGREADGRGRSVKRSLRSTLAFATNSFSFGRTSISHEGPLNGRGNGTTSRR
jgi:F-box and leucine-rich repeat protein GRR1